MQCGKKRILLVGGQAKNDQEEKYYKKCATEFQPDKKTFRCLGTLDLKADFQLRTAVFKDDGKILLMEHVGIDKDEKEPIYELELHNGFIRTKQETNAEQVGYQAPIIEE